MTSPLHSTITFNPAPHLQVGTRCLAGPGGHWRAGTIRAILADGTFKFEFDDKEMIIMPYWYGITQQEISHNDEEEWRTVYPKICNANGAFSWTAFHSIMNRLGYELNEEQAKLYWQEGCKRAFGREACDDNRTIVLEQEAAYRAFVELGLSAKRIGMGVNGGYRPSFSHFYWNQIRMGGRDPADLSRPIEIADAFDVLELDRHQSDARAVASLDRFERKFNVSIPESLRTFICRAHVQDRVRDMHPNNPMLLPVDQWSVRKKGIDAEEGAHVIKIMEPHQGDHVWCAVFQDGERDARVYIASYDDEDPVAELSAPSIGMFFWDLAQTGRSWFQETKEVIGQSGKSKVTGRPWWRFWK